MCVDNHADEEGTITAYSRMRRTYAFQRDKYLPLFFLREAEGGRGLPFIMERAAKVFIYWLDRELVRKMGRGLEKWKKFIRYLRWLRRLVRGLHMLSKVWKAVAIRRWCHFIALHRDQERQRCAVALQRIARGLRGRKVAYRRLRETSAWTIQMRWRMHVAEGVLKLLRTRRNAARSIQRMVRWRNERMAAATVIQAMARGREARRNFLHLRRQQTIMARFMKTRWARSLFLGNKRAALFAATRWRGKIARRLHWRLHNARIIQKYWRGTRSRLRVWHIRRGLHVTRVQTAWRAWVCRQLRAKRWWGLIIVQRELLRWCAKRRYRRMLWGRNRAKKEARIRVSVRPIQGELHVVAAVRPGRIEWTWSMSGKARTRSAKARYIVGKGLELHVFRVADSRVYRGFLTHEQLKMRHAMYARRGKKYPGGIYAKPFISLLFDQVTICKRTGKATIVQTTRSERGHLLTGFVIRRSHEEVENKLFIVQVYKHLDEFVFRAFDPEQCLTYRGELRLHHIKKRLTQTDAHIALTDEERAIGEDGAVSRPVLKWIVERMLLLENYYMLAFWKSPLFDEGVMLLDQQEDIMALRIQNMYRHWVARGRLYERIKEVYRKLWNNNHQRYYYLNRQTAEQGWDPPWILELSHRTDIDVRDIWDKIEFPDGRPTMYWNGAYDKWSPYSEDEASNIMADFYRRHILKEMVMPSFAQLAKAIKFTRKVVQTFSGAPTSLPAVLNMALYKHTITHDYAHAKLLYKQGIKMAPGNPTLLYCYGLFLLTDRKFVGSEHWWEEGNKMIEEARALDTRGDKFELCENAFFKFAVCINCRNAKALRNYALVLQVMHHDFKTADKFYTRSLKADIYDEATMVNYYDFLEQLKPGKAYDLAGPPLKLKKRGAEFAGTYYFYGEDFRPVEWERWKHPGKITHKHHSYFWIELEKARTRWLCPSWQPRGWGEKELTVMQAKRRVVLAAERYRKSRKNEDMIKKLNAASSQLSVYKQGDDGGSEETGPVDGVELVPEAPPTPEDKVTKAIKEAEHLQSMVQHDMEKVAELLDTTHTRLGEVELRNLTKTEEVAEKARKFVEKQEETNDEATRLVTISMQQIEKQRLLLEELTAKHERQVAALEEQRKAAEHATAELKLEQEKLAQTQMEIIERQGRGWFSRKKKKKKKK